MTGTFFKWFWSRRKSEEKFFLIAAPIDVFLAVGLQFTALSGPAILVLLVIATVMVGGLLALGLFIGGEYEEYQKQKELEAQAILRKLRGPSEEEKETMDKIKSLAGLKAYASAAVKKMP